MTTRRLPAVAFSLLTSVFPIAGIMTSPAHASPTPNTQGDDQPVSTNAPELYSSRSSTQEIDTAGYWTEERMRSAIPAEELIEEAASKAYQSNVPQSIERSGELGVTGDSSYPVYPKPTPGLLTRNPVVPATTGKVFFTYKGKNYVCSGSVINGVTKNVVSTAGHCVHGGKGEGWHENIAFAPGYHNGVSTYGLWNWKTAHTFQGWTNSSDFSRDQAFFTVHPRNGRTLVDTVGGNGLSYNYGHNQTGVRIWGWFAESPFNGEVPYYCDGSTRKQSFLSQDMVMPCNMTGGASGGPWLRSRIDENLGYVFGVTSRRTTSRERLLISTPFDAAVNNLFQGIK